MQLYKGTYTSNRFLLKQNVEIMEKIRTLDLFTGIGGFSIGLRDICTSVAYCEIDASCRKVIQKNIRSGGLTDAPIFNDVSKLSLNNGDLYGLDIEMITAGSPCQDISSANPYGIGIHGPKSKLIFEVIRIADTIPTLNYILFENSRGIVHKGMDDILQKLRNRGFDYVWGIGSASECGALHRRSRWICLAYKTCGLSRIATMCDLNVLQGPLKSEPVRIVPYDLSLKAECGMLGNAVVPEFVMCMLQMLVKSIQASDEHETAYVKKKSKLAKHKLTMWDNDIANVK